MKYFFDDTANVAALLMEAFAWLNSGTPFREIFEPPSDWNILRGPGGGIDCIGLDQALYTAAEFCQPNEFVFVRESGDYQPHTRLTKVLDHLRGKAGNEQSARLVKMFEEREVEKLPEGKQNLDQSKFMPGDMLVLRQGGQFHMPIVLRGRKLINCLRPIGVVEGNLHDPTYATRLLAHFRPLAR